MLLKPCHANLFSDYKDLYQLLTNCQQAAIAKNARQIISLSIEIEPIDPLAVLQTIHQPDQIHFYFERNRHPILQSQQDQIAIAAIGAVETWQLQGHNRFSQAQYFIQNCLSETIVIGAGNLRFSGPHFFCSFTFFEQSSSRFSPFPPGTIFLPRWQICRHQNQGIAIANRIIEPTSDIESLSQELWQGFQTIQGIQNLTSDIQLYHSKVLHHQDITDINHFKSSVSASLEAIQNQEFNKIVLAHAIDVTAPFPFHLIHSLENLRRIYPDCYIFSTGNGKGQNFLGASPERLISIHEQSLITDALAGSAPRGKTAANDDNLASHLLGSDKERREHRVVAEFILDRLTHLGFTPYSSPVPHLFRLSNIQHLRTLIQAAALPTVHPLEIIAELHPTPAVAGAPREITCQRIRQYEHFDRALYAGPLGWLDHKGNCEFIVGIRSALIEGHRARLYGGAGIVAGSDPDRELAEVRLKLQTLLAALV